MPGRDGFDLLRAVRALPSPARAIPAAVLSAYLATEHASAAAAAGFQRFNEKPVQPLELVGQIAPAQSIEPSPGCLAAGATASALLIVNAAGASIAAIVDEPPRRRAWLTPARL
jgi:CheY-like chemotaxis protein